MRELKFKTAKEFSEGIALIEKEVESLPEGFSCHNIDRTNVWLLSGPQGDNGARMYVEPPTDLTEASVRSQFRLAVRSIRLGEMYAGTYEQDIVLRYLEERNAVIFTQLL